VAEGSDRERYQVVVHVDAATLAGDQDGAGACELEHGRALPPETARRLACDADLIRILERDGRPLSVGRKMRSVPPALRRALRSRDRCCRFPGCRQARFLHAHHLNHWARGGRTELSNLVALCGFHHRLLHEGGWTLERRPGGGLRFRRPNGAPLPSVPAPPRGERHQLLYRNGRAGLRLDDLTGAPRVSFDRLDLPLVVEGLAERDPRLRE
jgi:hypothetical protein